MRDLDAKQLITGDFICVYGDVVANIPLESALAAHRARGAKDKKAIMTMVLREAGEHHRTKSQSMRPAFVIDPITQRCVHYEQMRPRQTPRLDIPEEVLKEHVEVEVREDLIDCGIDICTPEVLAQYTDNFDWQMPRRGFLHGLLKDYETLQLMVHTHIATEGYAARVKNLQSYNAISKDIISRWSYPLCPDTNLLPDQSYQLQKGNVYKEDGVVLARSSVIRGKSVLGKATSVGESTMITESVIGRRCVIGKRVRISGAYIWDDTRIGDDTFITGAVVANEVDVGKKCRLQPGALVSYRVKISDRVEVQGSSRVTKVKRRQSHSIGTAEQATTDPKTVGETGEGHDLAFDEEEDEATEGLMPTIDRSLSADDSISDIESDEDDLSLSETAQNRASRSESFASINSDDSGHTRKSAQDFHYDATSTIVDQIEKGVDPNTIQLELQALRLSSNAEDKQIRRAVAVSLMKRIAILVESGTSPKDAVSKVIPPNKLLIQRCVRTGESNSFEEVEFLLYMQTDLVHRKEGSKILLFACYALSQEDLVEAEGFEQWWEDERSSATEQLGKVRTETKPLVEALIGDDDDDEEEDSE
jgi:translation initiation factor eIF-2B subunit epsilon